MPNIVIATDMVLFYHVGRSTRDRLEKLNKITLDQWKQEISEELPCAIMSFEELPWHRWRINHMITLALNRIWHNFGKESYNQVITEFNLDRVGYSQFS